MPSFIHFILLLIGVLLLSAGFYYPLHQFISLFFEPPSEKIILLTSKLLSVSGVCYLAYYYRLLHLAGFGLAFNFKYFIKNFGWGLCCGSLIIAPLFIILIITETRIISPNISMSLEHFVKFILAALLGAWVEEVFFRGILYSSIRRSCSFFMTAFLSSIYYATLHFISLPTLSPSWSSGFEMLMNSFSQYQLDDFFALFSLGILLAIMREITGNIALCIGLHASFIYCIKLIKHYTDYNLLIEDQGFTGQYDHIIGWLSTSWLFLMILVIIFFFCTKNLFKFSLKSNR